MKNLLIAYVTKTNTTKEIADSIAKTAKEKDWNVKVLPVSAIVGLKEFDAVLIGAPINAMKWLPEAVEFVRKHQDTLSNVPTAYYFVSYLMKSGAPRWRKLIDKSLNKVSAIVPPVMVGKFNGRVDSEFPAVARWIFGVKKETPLDLRDWSAIRAWSKTYIDNITSQVS